MLHYGYGMDLLLSIIKYIIDSEKSTYLLSKNVLNQATDYLRDYSTYFKVH
jgi:hypothetical protein